MKVLISFDKDCADPPNSYGLSVQNYYIGLLSIAKRTPCWKHKIYIEPIVKNETL